MSSNEGNRLLAPASESHPNFKFLCMKRSRSICGYWSVVKIENKILLVMCDCCDLPVKILLDFKRQGSSLIVRKRAASLALLMVVWGRSLLCTLSWWLIHCEICKWHSQGDTRDMALCPTKGNYTAPKGRLNPGCFSQSMGPQLALIQCLGPPHQDMPRLWPMSFLVEC